MSVRDKIAQEIGYFKYDSGGNLLFPDIQYEKSIDKILSYLTDEIKSIIQINAEELLESDMFDNSMERKGARVFYERLHQRGLRKTA